MHIYILIERLISFVIYIEWMLRFFLPFFFAFHFFLSFFFSNFFFQNFLLNRNFGRFKINTFHFWGKIFTQIYLAQSVSLLLTKLLHNPVMDLLQGFKHMGLNQKKQLLIYNVGKMKQQARLNMALTQDNQLNNGGILEQN